MIQDRPVVYENSREVYFHHSAFKLCSEFLSEVIIYIKGHSFFRITFINARNETVQPQ